VPVSDISVEAFLRHAQLFGPESVIETAEQLLPERELARLRVELDGLHRRSSRRASRLPRRRRSTHETLLACVALREQGLVVPYVAEKLGISVKWVMELLARYRRESAPLQGRKQVPDRPSSPSETAWLSGENAPETAETADSLQKPVQTQSQGGAATSGSGPCAESDGDPQGQWARG
jgi:hypothetical protein